MRPLELTSVPTGARELTIPPLPPPSAPAPSERPRRRAILLALLGLACFLAALWLLHRELAAYHYRDVAAALAALPPWHVVLALLGTAASYALLTMQDTLALVYLRRPLAYRRTALASFLGQALSHSAGHSLLSGGSVRYRLYSAWGLSTYEATAVVGFCEAAQWLGWATLGGLAFLLAPPQAVAGMPHLATRPVGALLLAGVAAFLVWCARRGRPISLRGWEVRLPSLPLTGAATAFSALDWALAGAALYWLLPPLPSVSVVAFAAIFMLAQTIGFVSQVPAGLGVFEAAMLLLLAPTGAPRAALLGGLLLFRAVYYLLPLCVAALLLGGHEALRHRAAVRRAASSLGAWVDSWVAPLVPHLFAVTTFVAGAVLLFSGATPAELERIRWLRGLLPLPLIELSHFLGSLVGVALLLLARGLQRRLDAAWLLTCGLLAAGAAASLAKGVDYEEAVLLLLMLAALLPCRRHFYRQADLAVPRLSAGWWVAIALVLASAVALGTFSFRHVEYSGELWWQFERSADAPRALRATVGAAVAALAFALARLLRPAPPERRAALRDLARVQAIVARSPATFAHLALVGDKELLLGTRGDAFLMFATAGRSWIALGDPVGPESEHAELVWRFREMVDRHGGWTVLYQVSRQSLPLYLDLGLTLLKVGEEARVPLPAFHLDGQERKKMRYVIHRLERDGCSFAVVPAAEVPPLLGELAEVSAEWLDHRRTREKGFSLGCFDEEYLRRTPVAVVRRGGRVVAFANLWLGAEREELSFDLMRHRADAPPGVMDYLLAELLLWGREQGYRWCNLGMAPLSGLESRALAPLWTRLGALLFRHGESLYNFQGVRHFKEKFDPVWEPRYLASPGGVALPRILAHLSALIAGGFKGVVAR
ncbi:MAG TPA: bifunctional lysylphosphatidylglycerol flippase/synthetase MprF [Thermoanaerobaculia bacterium]|nr:bifunctional lysylphosphatidylglycerol flippase/synthetase MprF [Thermoanaerobaculia bacterium]